MEIPKDVQYEILNNLDDTDLLAYCSTHKEASQICNQDSMFWQVRTIKRFGLDITTLKKYKGDRKWFDYYIELSKKDRSLYPVYTAAKAMEMEREDILQIMKAKGIEVEFIQEDGLEFYQQKNSYQVIPFAEGKYRSYFPDGKLEVEGDLINGERVGEWRAYYPDGSLVQQTIYAKYPGKDGEILEKNIRNMPSLNIYGKTGSSYSNCLEEAKLRKSKGKLKLCPEGYCTAKEKFEVYPSAYANAFAAKVCKGSQADMDGNTVNRYKESGEVKSESSGLSRWFEEKWVNVCEKKSNGDYKTCGRSKANLNSETYPYCRPLNKVEGTTVKTVGEMSEKEIDSMCKQKRSLEQGVDNKPSRVYVK
tara:strand:- start:84 stop:1172 length:1089 start_codon:yes stop_codon:yes gene_type:complete